MSDEDKTARTHDERIAMPEHHLYMAELPRQVLIAGITEYSLRDLEKLAREASQQSGELTEVCQLFGKPLYVRLDWRNKEQAKEEYDRIRTTIKEAFERAGWIEPPQKRPQDIYREVGE